MQVQAGYAQDELMLLFETAQSPIQPPPFLEWARGLRAFLDLPEGDQKEVLRFHQRQVQRPENPLSENEARYWVSAFLDCKPASFFSALGKKPMPVVENYKLSSEEMEAMVRLATSAFRDPLLAQELKKFDEKSGGANTSIIRALSAWLHQALKSESESPLGETHSRLLSLAEDNLGDRTSVLFDKILKSEPLA